MYNLIESWKFSPSFMYYNECVYEILNKKIIILQMNIINCSITIQISTTGTIVLWIALNLSAGDTLHDIIFLFQMDVTMHSISSM